MSDDRPSNEERAKGGELGDFDTLLEVEDFPVTADELIATYGDYEVQSVDGTKSLGEVLRSVDDETFGSADEVRSQALEELNRE
ncbi:hypothetical protein ACFFQF_32850 [Haladaptatus pallidirubidus]|uniref:DUF2795 domain-containing protein n=1 Tax=Haladaptatus pallidirubidus TaxID=1008152 RepID=A0AAV3UPC1_9EURY|nr:hypothetical protein [Haladaptatus pallidirubidus]